MAGRLYLVPTPIGNPEDLSPRARDLLSRVDVVAAEDTRHFVTLARAHGLPERALSLHDHNEAARVPQLLERLQAGNDVALVSDAGTPLINDPGFKLVEAAVTAGFQVVSLPGPSAVTTALAASGLPPVPFRFVGFPPRTAAKRRAFFESLVADPATIVCFEAPHRLRDTLRDARDALSDRPACLARNLTKPHERYERGRLSEIEAALAAEDRVRGEATLVIGGASPDAIGMDTADAAGDAGLLRAAGASSRTIAAFLTARHGLSRRDAYRLAQERPTSHR
jgi:16S rRNA (cytidine1402-2'-O)-methyltransferase